MGRGIDVLLVNPPPWDVTKPPVGLGYLSAYLQNKNLEVEVLDLNIELFHRIETKFRNLWQDENSFFWSQPKLFEEIYNQIEPLVNGFVEEKLRDIKPKIIAISVSDPRELITCKLVEFMKIKSKESKIIIGGPSTQAVENRESFRPILDKIEFMVLGSGEEVLCEISSSFGNTNFENSSNIKIMTLHGMKLVTPTTETEKNDKIFPTYNGFPMNKYTTQTLAMMWTRGCVGNCVFCKEIQIWPELIIKNPELFVDELEYHVKNNGINYFVFWDSALNSSVKKLMELCNLILERKLDIRWECLCIARKEMTYEMLKLMNTAGCQRIIYGIESGSDKILRKIRKMSTSKIGSKVLENTRKAGIKVAVNFIVGFPGETEEDFTDTLKFISKNKNNIDIIEGIQTFQLVPGTEIYQNYKKYDISMPDKDQNNQWFIGEENTFEIRTNRLRELVNLAKKNKIEIGHSRLNETKKFTTKKENLVESINNIPDEDKLLVNVKKRSNNPLVLFVECLKEHGVSYTFDRTKNYVINLKKNLA